LYCLSFHLQLLITPLVSFGHCIVSPSIYNFWLHLWYLCHCIISPSIYSFWLPLWYLLVIVLSLLPFTASDYPLVSFGHCIVSPSIYSFWLQLWYLLVIVLSLLPFTASDYTFGIFLSLYCPSFHLQLLITSLVSFGHCIVSPSIYSFRLHLWYLLVIVLSHLPFTASDYTFGIFWSLYCLSFHLQLLITALVSFGHCIVSPSIYVFWLPLCYLLVIVLSLLPYTPSDYSFVIFWSMYCLSFHLRLLITPLFSFGHCIVSPSIYSFWLKLWYLLVIVLSLLPFTASDYTFGIFWSLYCLSFHLQLLLTALVSFGHYIVSPSIYSFWLHLWYLLVIVLSLLPFTASDYTSGIFWSLNCLSFHLQLLITPLVSFDHWIVSPSIYSFWLQLWYLLVIILSLLPFTASDYSFGIFWSLYCLSFHLQLLITPLLSFSHCIVSPSIYSFWLKFWYLLVIVLSLLPFTSSDYTFGIFWSLYCLSFHLQLDYSFWYLLVIVLSLLPFSFWLHLWYLLVIVSSLLPFTASDYSFGIFWSLYCLSFHLQLDYSFWYLLIIVLSLLPFSFWLHLWYLLVIVSSLLPFTASDYSFGIFWSLYCLSFHLQFLITPLLSFGHCIVSPFI
jgi:hypothetical protein